MFQRQRSRCDNCILLAEFLVALKQGAEGVNLRSLLSSATTSVWMMGQTRHLIKCQTTGAHCPILKCPLFQCHALLGTTGPKSIYVNLRGLLVSWLDCEMVALSRKAGHYALSRLAGSLCTYAWIMYILHYSLHCAKCCKIDKSGLEDS